MQLGRGRGVYSASKIYILAQHDFTLFDKRIFIINKMKCKASN